MGVDGLGVVWAWGWPVLAMLADGPEAYRGFILPGHGVSSGRTRWRATVSYCDHLFWLKYVEADRTVRWLEISDDKGLGDGVVVCDSEELIRRRFATLLAEHERAGVPTPKVVMVHGAHRMDTREPVILGEEPLN